jgi:hypothetical protein
MATEALKYCAEMMTMTKTLHMNTVSITADERLWKLLGFDVYTNSESPQDTSFEKRASRFLVEALGNGYESEAAVIRAVALLSERREAQSLETARQKVAELEAKAAEGNRAAAGIQFALARQRGEV